MSRSATIATAARLLAPVVDSVGVVDGKTLRIGKRKIPFQGGVARFRRESGYNESFALQWKAFRLTQYDDSR